MEKYSVLNNDEMKKIIANIESIRGYAIRVKSIEPEVMDEVVTYYIKSLYYDIWITDRKWNLIKDKYVDFVHKFFPNAEIYQREDVVVPELPDLLDSLEKRLVINGLMFFDGIEKSKEEAEKIIIQINTQIKRYTKVGLSEKYGTSPYLATVDLGGIGGDLAAIWRTGTVYWGISGDYDQREEELIEVITKAYFIKYKD